MIEPALVWWFALGIQLLAIPGSLLPVLPGLALLPLGALLWLWAVGWNAAWPPLLLAGLLLLLGWAAEALGLLLGPARLQASRWAPIGAGLGLLAGLRNLRARLSWWPKIFRRDCRRAKGRAVARRRPTVLRA